MRQLDRSAIGALVDVSAVRADVTRAEVDEVIRIVRQYHCVCAAPMAWLAPYTIAALQGTDAVVTGVVGFPSGAETTEAKMFQTRQLVAAGCREIDMVMNISAFLSGEYDTVSRDIRAVLEAADGIPVKTILEVAYLSDDQICRGSELLAECGVAYIKTGTGWGPRPTTVDTIALIRRTIGDRARIKAAGGIRDLTTLEAMYTAGCDRFGLGVRTAEAILAQAAAAPE